MSDPYGTPPLFPAPEPEQVRAPASARDTARTARPSWTKYGGARVACQHCVLVLHEGGGRGPAPRSARHVRKVGRGRTWLCDAHARIQRTADGVEK